MTNLWIQHLEMKKGGTKIADQKLNLNINLGTIQYMGTSYWHYWLWIRVKTEMTHNTEIPNNGSNMADYNN